MEWGKRQWQQRHRRCRRQGGNGGWQDKDAAMAIFLAQQTFVGIDRRIGFQRRRRLGCGGGGRKALGQVVQMGLHQKALRGEEQEHNKAHQGSP